MCMHEHSPGPGVNRWVMHITYVHIIILWLFITIMTYIHQYTVSSIAGYHTFKIMILVTHCTVYHAMHGELGYQTHTLSKGSELSKELLCTKHTMLA